MLFWTPVLSGSSSLRREPPTALRSKPRDVRELPGLRIALKSIIVSFIFTKRSGARSVDLCLNEMGLLGSNLAPLVSVGMAGDA